MKRLARFSIIMVLILGLVAGCANFKKTSFATLDSTRVAVDTAMKVAGELYQQGTISEEDKDKIIDIHDKYRATHKLLCELLIMYDSMEKNNVAQKSLKEQISMAIAELISRANEIGAIVTEMINRQGSAPKDGLKRIVDLIDQETDEIVSIAMATIS